MVPIYIECKEATSSWTSLLCRVKSMNKSKTQLICVYIFTQWRTFSLYGITPPLLLWWYKKYGHSIKCSHTHTHTRKYFSRIIGAFFITYTCFVLFFIYDLPLVSALVSANLTSLLLLLLHCFFPPLLLHIIGSFRFSFCKSHIKMGFTVHLPPTFLLVYFFCLAFCLVCLLP